jgi:phosphopentomutase/2,3-bisphosphoglycerate-independent phosphoglycerate mutase family metalloenzyme
MKVLTGSKHLCALAFFVVAFVSAASAQPSAAHKTENVIVVMMDGVRWLDVFHGADSELLKTLGTEALDSPEVRAAQATQLFGQGNPVDRRQALMPFLWSVVAHHGQIFGNRDLGSDSHVTNGLNFSYPGYSETLTGFVDPRIHSNDNVPNPNVTVFEWLNAKPAFAGKVAAFGSWDVYNGIFNRERCGFVVNAGYDPLTAIPATPELTLLNQLKAETTRISSEGPFDPISFHTAVEYIKAKQPRLLFLGLLETDSWGHAGSYAEYLNAMHRDDAYLRALWDMIQSMPAYANKTTLIVLPDHGRGRGAEWTSHGNHGKMIEGGEQTWMGFLGPDTPALGERRQAPPVTESQIAATIAALLGEDYHAAVPRSGAPIADVIGK